MCRERAEDSDTRQHVVPARPLRAVVKAARGMVIALGDGASVTGRASSGYRSAVS